MRRELLREVARGGAARADDARADGGRQPAVHPWPSTQPAAVQFGAALKKCAPLLGPRITCCSCGQAAHSLPCKPQGLHTFFLSLLLF